MTKDTKADKGSTEPAQTQPQNDGFVDVVTDRTMYKADTCKETPLQGYLINKIPMPPIRNRVWYAFVIRTTAPVQSEDRDVNVIIVPPGSEVLISATSILESALTRAAVGPIVHEVRISPIKKIDIGAGQTMWTYNIKAKPDSGIARNKFGFSAMLGTAPEALQLTQGTNDDQIPF
jgi:hypothetical protein